jgi:hypothetical protein
LSATNEQIGKLTGLDGIGSEFSWQVRNNIDNAPAPFRSTIKEIFQWREKIIHENACACHIGDSPEVLEFVAKLSLAKTVGDAEALLAALN